MNNGMRQYSSVEHPTMVPTLYEELNSPTFPANARNFSLTKLTCNSYFSLHFSRLLPYTDSLCYHYHIWIHTNFHRVYPLVPPF